VTGSIIIYNHTNAGDVSGFEPITYRSASKLY